MPEKYYIGDDNIINLENIVAAEVDRTWSTEEEVRQVNVHVGGSQIILFGGEATDFWREYREFARVRNVKE